MPSSHLILCCPLLLLPPIPPRIRVFSNESTFRMRWPKYWSFSFSISPINEHLGLISFRMDWLDLLAVQGTLKSLLQLSHPYMTTRKTIALTRQTFVGKVMSLLFNMLSRLVTTYCLFHTVESESRSVMSDCWRPHGLYSPWNSPGQNTGVGSLSLLQGIFPNPGIEPRSPALQVDSLPAEPQGKSKNTGVGSLACLQGIFLTQKSN